ncbi:MAG: hypothetical protein LWX83_10075 [Anaerolineae bacterium]|nr:hypothetical protein [Anaerolineae bacterium]
MKPVRLFFHAHRKLVAWGFLLAVLFAMLVLLYRSIQPFMPFISDDAFISLRYSQRLLAGHGLTWTEGRPVEGYSNLLWVLAVALLGWPGMDLVDAARLLGYTGMGAGVLAILATHWPDRPSRMAAGLIGSAAFALAAPIAIWSIGGLEQPLLLALLAWAWFFTIKSMSNDAQNSRRYTLPAGLMFGLACLTRPDAPLFVAAAVAAVLLQAGFKRKGWVTAAWLVIIPLVFYGGQTLFRYFYYGELVPNTALVKAVFTWKRLLEGLAYVRKGFLPLGLLGPAAILTLVAACFSHKNRPEIYLFGFSAVAWAVYLILIGGDIFPGWRHITPLILIFAFTIANGVEWLWDDLFLRLANRPYLSSGLMVCFSLLALVYLFRFYYYDQRRDEVNLYAIQERWEWKAVPVGEMLKRGFGAQQPLLAVDAAGSLPYYSELPILDMLGLNDYYLPRHPPKDFGQGAIGHELGDGNYFLERNPDLIIFCYPDGKIEPCFNGGKQMVADAAFAERYSLATFLAPPLPEKQVNDSTAFYAWVNRFSPGIGIRQTQKQITVPAYLINDNAATYIHLDEQNQFYIVVDPSQEARLKNLPVPAGKWEILVDPLKSAPALKVSVSGAQITSGELTLPARVNLQRDDLISLRLTSSQQSANIKAILFNRLD